MSAASIVPLLARTVLVAAAVALATMMVGPFQGLELALVPWDKAAHFLAFYGLTLLLYLSFPRARRLDLTLYAAFAGSLVEALQGAAGRDAGLGDVLANAAGAFAALTPMYVERLRTLSRGGAAPERRRRAADRPRIAGDVTAPAVLKPAPATSRK